jgi:hypothetical protein
MTTKLFAGLIVSAVLVTVPVSASAQIAAPKNSYVAKAAAPEDASGKATVADKKVCKQLPSSSSRLPQRACLTTREWLKVQEDLER